MKKRFRIQVFGKQGCPKCSVLNSRLDKILDEPEWQNFEKEYIDIETEDGLIAFCEAECINPQRIPALLIAELDTEGKVYKPVPRKKPGQEDTVCSDAGLFQYVGLQTDYTEKGKGILSPKMLTSTMAEAMS